MLWHLYCITSMDIFVRTFPDISLLEFPTRPIAALGLANVLAFLGYMFWAWSSRIDWSVYPTKWDWASTPMGLRIMCYPLPPNTVLGVIWSIIGSLLRLALTIE